MSGERLVLRLSLAAGRVAAVRIRSPRVDVAPLFVGRRPDEAVALARTLFSLCPMAQSLALQAACEAACGAALESSERARRALALLCERYGEMLRASVLDWPSDTPPEQAVIADLRTSLTGLRALNGGRREALASVSAAARRLGLDNFQSGETFFARQWLDIVADRQDWAIASVDFLQPADDVTVARAMDDASFARAPRLPGRCLETGALARSPALGRKQAAADLVERLSARFADMATTLDAIAALLDGGPAPDDLLSCGVIGPRQGFAAVETGRGRLYHRLRLDKDERIAACRIVAPTEWNFHPEGPLVRQLTGAKIGEGSVARRRAERLAFVFDPCLGIEVVIEENVYA